MQVVEGTVGLIGAGTWTAKGDGGSTTLSVLEIGNKTFKRIILTDYLSNYVTAGQNVRALISQGLTRGLVSRPFIAAVQVEGKTYKTEQVLMMMVLKTVLWLMICGVVGALFWPLGIALAAYVVYFYAKSYLDYKKF